MSKSPAYSKCAGLLEFLMTHEPPAPWVRCDGHVQGKGGHSYIWWELRHRITKLSEREREDFGLEFIKWVPKDE